MSLSRKIGPYWQGEIPRPFTFQFLGADGGPIDLSGFEIDVVVSKPTGAVSAPGEIADAENGQASYEWSATDTDTVGSCSLQFWAGNGTVRIASPLLVFRVNDPPGTAPAI